jgi:trimethylamine--corrinoid protein Co-methyltransferase
MLEMGVTFDFGQLVMDNEFARMIKHAVQGIPVNDETLAVDVIKEVGPFKDFLSHKHTLRHMRSQSQPVLIDRRRRSKWEQAGGTDIYQRATEKAREILETHKPGSLASINSFCLGGKIEWKRCTLKFQRLLFREIWRKACNDPLCLNGRSTWTLS